MGLNKTQAPAVGKPHNFPGTIVRKTGENRVGGLEGDKTQLFGEDFLEEVLSELSKC